MTTNFRSKTLGLPEIKRMHVEGSDLVRSLSRTRFLCDVLVSSKQHNLTDWAIGK
jgi:hypothetical protein